MADHDGTRDAATDPLEARKLAFEESKFERTLALERFKAIWISGVIAVAVAIITATGSLLVHQLDKAIKQQELDLKRIDQQREFLQAFVKDAMNEDIRVRVRLAHYVLSTVDDPELKRKWTAFHDELLKFCEHEYRQSLQLGNTDNAVRVQTSVDCRIGGVDRVQQNPQSKSFGLDLSALARLFASVDQQSRAKTLLLSLQDSGLLNNSGAIQVLSEAAHETGGFRVFSESLDYPAEKVLSIWGRRFQLRTIEDAAQYAHDPEKLGNLIYNRPGFGNRPEDGFKYRGRGYFSLTGKANYDRISQLLQLDLVGSPDLALDPTVAARIVVAFLKTTPRAVDAANAGDTTAFRRFVNGGNVGIGSVRGWAAKIIDAGLITGGLIPDSSVDAAQ